MQKRLNIAFILLIVAVILIVLCPTLSLMIPFSVVGIILSITFIIFNHLAKKELKGKKTYPFYSIFGILVLVFCLLELFGTIMLNFPDLNDQICRRDDLVSKCVDQGNGISKCEFNGSINIPCYSDVVEDR